MLLPVENPDAHPAELFLAPLGAGTSQTGAMAAIDGKIVLDNDGLPVVTDTSGPTGPGTFEEYAAVPLEDDIGYGAGAVILALIESSGLPPAP